MVEGRRRPRKESTATFFFTHFPDNFDERRMWKVFERWGRVVDIYIPRKRTKEEKRFGFVRMVGIADPEYLARQIDQMFIGNMKLYVNVPRFAKEGDKGRRSAFDDRRENKQ
ncbi:uncharacterized protein LOC130737342 [Lotus japonicus]|uniref:uncharacterized protein LOC130737342 n=1 Tax=Lotus japonicus TaxID=34305 RepID=UPI00258EAD16|nr:uncharacterized protein LOC130737342 [Lotus japonicus]